MHVNAVHEHPCGPVGGERPEVFHGGSEVPEGGPGDGEGGRGGFLCVGPRVPVTNGGGHFAGSGGGEMSPPPHQHVNEECIVLMEGALEVYINGKITTA